MDFFIQIRKRKKQLQAIKLNWILPNKYPQMLKYNNLVQTTNLTTYIY